MEIQEVAQIGQIADILSVKPGARILDATAANRCIWEIKDSPFIVFMDVESELEVKPDILCDNRRTPYSNGYFYIIIFDPPHDWGAKTGERIDTCRNRNEYKKIKDLHKINRWGTLPSYYGIDKYHSKIELLGYLNKALQEFYRILEEGGILMMKWCEIKIPFERITPFLRDWSIMMKLKIGDDLQTRGSTQTWWILLMKKEKRFTQSEFCTPKSEKDSDRANRVRLVPEVTASSGDVEK